MKTPALVLALLVAAGTAAAAPAAPQPLQAQVVSVSVTFQSFNEGQPWAKNNPGSREIAAVVVDGPLLLTTASDVADATMIQLLKHGRADRFTARVLHIDYEINLALLAVEDPAFFADLVPARLATAVPTSGVVQSVRWRNRQFESSASRVSRLEVGETELSYLSHMFLVLTTDLDGGGWSEPVFDGRGDLVGLTASQNDRTAKVIPAEILGAYLRAARVAPYRGFAALGLAWQVNRDATLARYLGQTTGVRGVIVRQVPWGSFGCGVLQPRDILLSIDGHAIDADGFSEHPRYGRLRMDHFAVEGHQAGDIVPVQVLRAGQLLDLKIALPAYPTASRLVPWIRPGTPPPYLLAGGFLFREFDAAYLRLWGNEWRKKAPLNLLVSFDLDGTTQRADQRRLVLLQTVLPDAFNIGYQDLSNLLVSEVNGRPVDSLADVEDAFRHPVGGFHVIAFHPNGERAEAVLDAAQFAAATARIVAQYQVPSPMRLAADAPPPLGLECGAPATAAAH